MILSRSLARVRPMGPYGIGRPYVLDYKRGIMRPYVGTGEWDRTRDKRLWALDWRGAAEPWMRIKRRFQDAFLLPTMQLNFGWTGQNQNDGPRIGYLSSAASFSVTSFALDTNYVYGTSGDAIMTRLSMITARTFVNLYFNITSYTGTAANVNDITVEIRNDSGNKPGSTVHSTVVVDPASATGWITAASSFAGSAQTVYWLVVGDLDGNGTDCANVLGRQSTIFPDTVTRWGSTVTDGFAAAPTPVAFIGGLVAEYTVGSAGIPFATNTASTSSANARGLNISSGLTETIAAYGFVWLTVGDADAANVSIFSGSTGPDDDPVGTFSVPVPGATEQGFVGAPYTIPKETQTRFVCFFTGTSVSPQKLNIGTGTTAGLRASMLGGGNMYWAEEDSSGSPDTWGNDDINAWPRAAVLIEDQIAVASGSGGSNRVYGS